MSSIGMMSGTSLDGIDVAIIKTDGRDVVHRGAARTYPYEPDQRELLRGAIVAAAQLTDRFSRPGNLAAVEWSVSEWHAVAVEKFCEETGTASSEIDVVGFHGQTVLHRPEIHLTVQLGDGPLLARRLGKPVVHDMRAADIAAGGQGAPLAPVYHRALAARFVERPIAFVNIGGVANMTWIGAGDDIAAFDTGPGNAMLNDWCERHLGEAFDRDGALAARGILDGKAFMALARHPYFEMPIPKSLDRNAFDMKVLEGLSPEDGAATLVHFTATSIGRAAGRFAKRPKLYIICGGGRRNPTLMNVIRELFEPLGEKVLSAEEAGFDGDSIEAEAWGYLAVRSMLGQPLTYPMTTGVAEPKMGGVLAQPG